MTFFSIIATDYDGTVSRDTLQRFIDALKAQTFKDFEVLIMHDGKRTVDISDLDLGDLNIKFLNSIFRGNVWGHNLRSFGMSEAKGKFLINTNTDNIYYPNSLQELHDCIEQYSSFEIFINKVKMMGLSCVEERTPIGNGQEFVRRVLKYDKPRNYSKSLILTGDPPVFGNIDLMCLVASKEVYKKIYYWYDLSPSSDAVVYGKLCSLFPYKHTGILLGEHY